MQPRPLSDVRVQKGTMEFRFQCRDGRFPTPLPLISLGSGEGEILVTSMGVSGKLCVRAGEKVLESPYVPDLRSPLKMTLVPSGKKMRIYFDDALQGELELPAKWSSLRLLKAVDGVKFLTEDPAPDPILSSVEISPLEQKLWSPEGAEQRCLADVQGGPLFQRAPGGGGTALFPSSRKSPLGDVSALPGEERFPGGCRTIPWKAVRRMVSENFFRAGGVEGKTDLSQI